MPVPRTPLLTTDCVVFNDHGAVLLIERGNPPFKGKLALPGGFVDVNESVEQACRRELAEETGLKVGRLHLVGVYSKPGRDVRGPTCSIAYCASSRGGRATAGDDAAATHWVAGWRRLTLAFDHKSMIRDALRVLEARKQLS